MKPQRLALLIALLTLAAVAIALMPVLAPSSKVAQRLRPKPGLDISGGMRVVLEAQTEKLPQGKEWNKDTQNAVRQIIDRRVNANGVAEPNIVFKPNKQYIVEIPDIANKEDVAKQLQNTAQLQFFYSPDWRTRRNNLGRYEFKVIDGEGGKREQYQIYDSTTKLQFRDPYHLNSALQELIANGRKPGVSTASVPVPTELADYAAVAGTQSINLTADDVKTLKTLAEEAGAFAAFLKDAGEPKLTGNDLKPTAIGSFDPSGGAKPQVSLEFNAEGARKFADFTTEHTNEILMIFLDGQILMAPNIEVPIRDGRAQISPFPTVKDAQNLANYLNGGALPVPLKIVQQQSIEATLGNDAVRQGLTAGIVGLGLVVLFMIGYYLLPGAMACVALVLYTLFTYAVFVLIPVTFTLPGIAGFILSVGMAVDANVLIFERTKEELRAGKTLKAAIEAGFKRAFSAILDSNVCTAITSILLYNFGTGPVKGFALTLLIGVVISMFTAITVTRTLLLLLVNTAAGKNLNAWGLSRTWQPRLNVVGKRNNWFALSALLIVPGLIFLAMGGLKPGIDFTGGSELILKFTQTVDRAQVEKTVADSGIAEPSVQLAEGNTAYVRMKEVPVEQADKAVAALQSQFPGVTKIAFESIGSAISTELTVNALNAIVLSSVLIVLYLSFRFAIGGFVNGLKFGVCAIIAMLHDVAVLIGAFAILGYFLNWKVDSLFVTALLTVVGFSVHDTIVIFDRIRENLVHRARGESFGELVNKSINETFTRSVNTSVTVILTLLALLVLGGPVIRLLNAALLIGIVSGTFSSIFNAAPLVVVWEAILGKRGGGTTPSLATAGAGGGGSRPIPPVTPREPVGSGARTYTTPNSTSNGAAPTGDDGAARPRPGTTLPPGPRRKRRM